MNLVCVSRHLFYMFVSEQMILAIFIISVTFGTETEFQAGIIQFRAAAYRAAVLSAASWARRCV